MAAIHWGKKNTGNISYLFVCLIVIWSAYIVYQIHVRQGPFSPMHDQAFIIMMEMFLCDKSSKVLIVMAFPPSLMA